MELIIVIVVIAVLATIVIVMYRGIQREARNTTRLTELRSWVDIFEIYKARKGVYPGGSYPDDTGVCLGTGFPVSSIDNKRRCRDPGGSLSYLESDNSALMADILTVAKMPPSDKTPAATWLTGPWVEFYTGSWNQIRISTAIESEDDTDCTKGGFTRQWNDPGSTAMICTAYFNSAW